MKNVTLTFVGDGSDEIAQKFYIWMLNGGLEDVMIQNLSDDNINVEGITDFNNESLSIAIKSDFPTEE